MITLNYNGTLGNNLWQYSVARLFAEKSEMLMIAPRIPGFSLCKPVNFGKVKLGTKETYFGHYLPKNMPIKRTHFNGTFERYENIAGSIEKIKTWVKPDEQPDYFPGMEDLVLSIRRGFNHWPINLCPSVEYYEELVGKFDYKTLWVCTDSPDDPYIQDLIDKTRNSKLVRMSANKQFSFIASSQRVIMAPSTFTFWATMIGTSSKIYWPRIPALDFTQTSQNWFPYDDPRVEWVEL